MPSTDYDTIADFVESDLDCLSLDALFAELFIEDELDTTPSTDLSDY